MPTFQPYDALIIGGGLFGCYAALYLAGKGARVALLEKEGRLFQKASLVNQARLHGGYHYPRSLATAAMSDEHKARFTDEHRAFVNFSFEKYYAVDRFGSFTDARQFERFCAFLDIRCERVTDHPLFNYERLEALYRTEEFSFDPVLLREYYTQRVEAHPAIEVFTAMHLLAAGASGDEWIVEAVRDRAATIPHGLERTDAVVTEFSGTVTRRQPEQQYAGREAGEDGGEPVRQFRAPLVINATYAGTNSINRLFGVRDLDLTHEISEIAFITSPQFGERGLTVMDGPFGSIMPYGRTGLLSLSSVAYTHHKISYENLPTFDCQDPADPFCRPERPGICTVCPRRPESNARKMLRQMQQYFAPAVAFEYFFSYFTIKSKLKANYIDDGRPTEISQLCAAPRFYCLFAGKVNSIYEVEKIVDVAG
jgi:glycine/D-amino acid oxidase-like deaminating enzyme